MKFQYLISLLFTLITIQVKAQYIDDQSSTDFFNLTTEHGLSQNTVNVIIKDRSGYLWFGTDDGLNRYNSYDIEVIEINPEKPKNMAGKKVNDLYEDTKGMIWIGTEDGLKLYNPVNNSVVRCKLFENFSLPIQVNRIIKEDDSNTWLATSEGLILYNLEAGVVEHYRHAPERSNSLADSYVTSLVEDGENIWVGTINGLSKFNKKGKKFKNYYNNENNPNSIADSHITDLALSKNGDLWIGSLKGGVSLLKKQNQKFITYNTQNSKLPHNEIFDIFISDEGYIWFATNGGGLVKLDISHDKFTVFYHTPNHVQSLVTNAIYSVYEDNDGILWVGTYSGGVCYNTSKKSIFKLVRHQVHDPNSIVESRVRSLFLDSKENLWIGTLGGVSVYNPNTKLYKSYTHDPANPSSLSFNTVTSVFEDNQNNMWFGTYSGGLNMLKPNKEGFIRFKHNSKNENSISNDKIYCFALDKEENLWVGTQAGLNLYNPSNNSFKHYGDLEIRDIKVTKNNLLVIASIGGISVFDPKSKTFKDYYSNELVSFPITQILLENDAKTIWFCSQGRGFGYLDLTNNSFSFFTEEDGLPSNFTSAIIKTDTDNFWISTYNGLTKFNKNSRTFTNFAETYNEPSKQFQPKAAIVLPDNSLGFGGSKGLVIFHPDNLTNKKNAPKIVLTSFKIDNKIVDVQSKKSPLKKNIDFIEEIQLLAGQNDFSIDFAALDFSNSSGIKYAYKLEPYMNEWVDNGNNRDVGFTNLNHGDYTLKLRVINNNTSASERSIKISIAPPFHATWWFKTLIGIVIVLMLYYYKKYTIISTKQKNENELQRLKLKNEEEFNQMRFRFFTYISHELRTPLTLISDPISQLIKNNKNRENKDMQLLHLINNNVVRLVRLVDQILDISKLEGDTLSLQVSEQNIVECIENTAGAFHEFAAQNDITFEFETQEKFVIGWVDEDKIEKILYNLLSNAFKFTVKNGHVTILLKYLEESKDYISISVKDDGIGIAEDKLSKIFEGFYQVRSAKSLNPHGAGIGLDYVKRLAKLHLGSISVESKLHEGSTFMVTIPIKKEAYNIKNIKNYIPQRQPLKPINLVKENPETEIVTKVHNKHTAKILVVEDDFDIRAYIVESLSVKFKVIEAPNGEDGLVKALKHKPDLILSDTLMPVMDGIEFCKRIKENEKTNHIPFLFLSAWTSDEFKVKGLGNGAIDYIQKPFNIQILESRISNIIETNNKISAKSKTMVNFIPENKGLESMDNKFIKKAYEILDKNFDNPDFNADNFKKEMGMSHSALYRKLTELTGKSSNEFIRDYRLKRATQIIKQNSGLLIAEICLKSGFNDPKYFSKCFKQTYNMTPSEYTNKYADQNGQDQDTENYML